jgi:hypothetical protein
MMPQPQPRKPRNSSRVDLIISVTFHTVILAALVYFAAREGLLGKQLRKITIEMVKEKPPEKPKEPEKPKVELPKIEPPKVEAAKVEAPKTVPQTGSAPPASAAPVVAPENADVPNIVFDDGAHTVETSSDPIQLYKSFVEHSLRSNWQRPPDISDEFYVALVEVTIDRDGQISDPAWKKSSGDARWDDSVNRAIAATPTVNHPPPKNFPTRVLVRFDVQEEADAGIQ